MSAIALSGCQQAATVTFDSPRPWHVSADAYEKLDYTVNVYDTSNGSDEQTRVLIANGTANYTLSDRTRMDGTVSYSLFETSWQITYNDAAPEKDRGLTDAITSTLEFQTDSLVASSMQKTVTLSPRADETVNLSYSLSADYFNEHKATLTMSGEEPQTMSLPNGTYYDNEMMVFLARATAIGKSSMNNFFMTNIFDSFKSHKFVNYTMQASSDASLVTLDIGDWVADFGVEAVTNEESGEVNYPLSCYRTSIAISDARRGQPFYAYYTENPFMHNEDKHTKIPVTMHFSEYQGSKAVRLTEYTLNACSFVKD